MSTKTPTTDVIAEVEALHDDHRQDMKLLALEITRLHAELKKADTLALEESKMRIAAQARCAAAETASRKLIQRLKNSDEMLQAEIARSGAIEAERDAAVAGAVAVQEECARLAGIATHPVYVHPGTEPVGRLEQKDIDYRGYIVDEIRRLQSDPILAGRALIEKTRREENERCAVAAWNYLIDNCMRLGVNPSVHNQWFGACSAIRAILNEQETKNG